MSDPSLPMATLKCRIKTLHDFLSPNVVKVVTDPNGNVLYFSRSPLPFFRDKWNDLKDEAFASGKLLCYKHVGLYVYRREFLPVFAALAPTYLETGRKAGAVAGPGERLPHQGGGDGVRVDRGRHPGGPGQGAGKA